MKNKGVLLLLLIGAAVVVIMLQQQPADGASGDFTLTLEKELDDVLR